MSDTYLKQRTNVNSYNFQECQQTEREVLIFSSHTRRFLWRIRGLNATPWGDHSVLHSPSSAGRSQKRLSSQGFVRVALVSLWRQLCPHTFPTPSPGALQWLLVEAYSIRPHLFHLLRRVLLPEKTPKGCLFQFVFAHEE